MITASDARRELMRLTAERLDALETGQETDASYLTELDCEIDECLGSSGISEPPTRSLPRRADRV